MKRTIWGWVAVSTVLAAGAAQAQTTLATDEIPAPPYAARNDMVVERGPYAALPPADVYGEEIIPPFQAARNLRASGYQLLSRPVRRGLTYVAAVINPRGLEGRALLDAHSGQLIRFVPMAYGEDPAAGYGPPGPPHEMTARPGPRPPAAVPHVATRMPPVSMPAASAPTGATPGADGRAAPAPAAAQAAQQPASPTAQQQAAATPPGPATADATAVKPATATKPPVVLQPTQPMPPVQDLE